MRSVWLTVTAIVLIFAQLLCEVADARSVYSAQQTSAESVLSADDQSTRGSCPQGDCTDIDGESLLTAGEACHCYGCTVTFLNGAPRQANHHFNLHYLVPGAFPPLIQREYQPRLRPPIR